ncbi:MAG TPA: hypothetical protein ENF75_06240 [Acidilobales archaeon]|nr:MAG: hypothetical protein DRO18_04240 [Thermoprotei archaeon]HDD26667.1 hypothetical protein [Acidilobales archaeon]
MYREPSLILRYGVITGLAVSLAGLVINEVFGVGTVTLIGMFIIVLTPLTSLITISLKLASKKDLRKFTLSQITIAVIIASLIISMLTK